MNLHIWIKIARRALPALVLAAVTVAVFFAARDMAGAPPAPNGEDTPATGTVPGDGDSAGMTPPVQPVDTPQRATTREDILRLSAKIPFLQSLYYADDLRAQGLTLSALDFTKETAVLARMTNTGDLPTVFSQTDGTRTVLTYENDPYSGAPYPVYTESTVALPAVQMYMGYLLLEDAAQVHVLDADGKTLLAYPRGEYTPAYTREVTGAPLFYKTGEGDTRLYYRIENRTFVPSDYDDTTEGRGVYFDYPAHYGVTDNHLHRIVKPLTTVETKLDGTETVTDSLLWAFGRTAAWRTTGFHFTHAYSFSEERAAVLDEDGRMYFLKENGFAAFYTEKNYYYQDRYVTEYLLPPLTAGEESIGFYYFDHGLCRVRRQVVDWYNLTARDKLLVAIDKDILIDASGNEFPIPGGYSIVSYSDGVILLEKDGKYGYMDYTGAWIAQPIYDYARPFFEGLAVVGFSDGTRLMIDTEGSIVIPAGYFTYISDASSGVIAAFGTDGGWQIFHKMMRVVDADA